MAKENVKKFFEEVSKSEELQKKLKAVISEHECEIAKNIKAQTK